MLLALPILLPMFAAATCFIFWGKARYAATVTILTTAAMTVVAIALLWTANTVGIQTLELGGWAAPFGITLVADRLGAIMVLLASVSGLAVSIFSVGSIDPRRAAAGHYPLMLTLLAAVCGAFVAGDLFNLYVWFELMLLSSFVLLTLGGERAQLEGAIKYVTLNLLSSVLFLAAVGLIYGLTGTLNMAHLALRLDTLDPAKATAIGAPLLVGFGIKAAVFPLFFWLPASYHTPPPAVSAIFAGLLTKVGVYSLIRAITLMFDQELDITGQVIIVVAGLTMLSGVLGAVAQNDMRRILSFHIVSQIGYMLMGLGIAAVVLSRASEPDAPAGSVELATLALSGAIFYILHHIIVKTNLFLISGAVIRVRGSSSLFETGGLLRTNPFLSTLFLLSALSLAGIPVLSGFWPKLTLVRAGLEADMPFIVTVSLVVSLLTLLSMTKIWSNAFWGVAPEGTKPRSAGPWILAPIVTMLVLTLGVSVGAPAVFGLAHATAEELIDSDRYIRAVLPAELIQAERASLRRGEGGAP